MRPRNYFNIGDFNDIKNIVNLVAAFIFQNTRLMPQTANYHTTAVHNHKLSQNEK